MSEIPKKPEFNVDDWIIYQCEACGHRRKKGEKHEGRFVKSLCPFWEYTYYGAIVTMIYVPLAFIYIKFL
jgi:hypothetical protein